MAPWSGPKKLKFRSAAVTAPDDPAEEAFHTSHMSQSARVGAGVSLILPQAVTAFSASTVAVVYQVVGYYAQNPQLDAPQASKKTDNSIHNRLNVGA